MLKWIACTYLFLLLLVPYHPELYVNIVPLQIKAVLNTRINLSEYIKDAQTDRHYILHQINRTLMLLLFFTKILFLQNYIKQDYLL